MVQNYIMYEAMCGACPARANWFFASKDKKKRDEWAHSHLTTFGHGVGFSTREVMEVNDDNDKDRESPE